MGGAGEHDATLLPLRPRQHLRGRRQELGAGEPELEVEAHGGLDPGGGDVVAGAGPRHDAVLDGTAMLLEGHDVGHQLTGMGAVGETVDHGHLGVRRELEQGVVAAGADEDGVDEAREPKVSPRASSMSPALSVIV